MGDKRQKKTHVTETLNDYVEFVEEVMSQLGLPKKERHREQFSDPNDVDPFNFLGTLAF